MATGKQIIDHARAQVKASPPGTLLALKWKAVLAALGNLEQVTITVTKE